MTWHEWEQAKAAAAERTGGTRLNAAAAQDGGGGGNGDDLTVRDDELGALGNMAFDLRGRLARDGAHAKRATADAAAELRSDGLETGSALSELHDAWDTKLGTLKEACAHISNHLDYSRAEHARDEEKIETRMRSADGQLMSVSRIHDFIK